MSLALLFHYLMLNMFRMLIHPSSVCRLRHWCLSLHTDTTPPQPNHNVTPTHIEPYTTHEITQQISRQLLLRKDVLTSGTFRALNNEIIKQVTSSWSLFIQLFLRQFIYTIAIRLFNILAAVFFYFHVMLIVDKC